MLITSTNQPRLIRPAIVAGTGVEDQTDLSTYTFNGVNIGGGPADHRIVGAFVGVFGATAVLNSVTINGSSCTILGPALGDSSQAYFVYRPVVTGTTANFVVTFNETQSNCYVLPYSIYSMHNAPVSTSFPTGGLAAERSVTLNIPANAFALVGTVRTSAGTGWSGNVTAAANSGGTNSAYRGPVDADESNVVITYNTTRTICGVVWR